MYKQFLDSLSDMEANKAGMSCPLWVSCECCCKKFHDQAPSIKPGDWF